MDDIEKFEHHITVEELSEVLCAKTERNAAPFFRVLSVYYMGIVASCLRAQISSPAFGDIPINNYAIALAPSGFGKGKSTGCLENEIMVEFRDNFRHYVMPAIANGHIAKLASKHAAIHGTDEAKEEEAFVRDYNACGEFPFVFDGGSEAAIKQVRQKLLIANSGSINFQVDEIGTNLAKPSTTEAMAVYLELYDTGRIKNKVKVNSAENKRARELEGTTPANMLLFGTPSKLLDGANTEKQFLSMLDTGYARRSLFAWADGSSFVETDDDEDAIYERLTAPSNFQAIAKWRQHFAFLADATKLGWTVAVPESVDKLLIRYKMDCARRMKEISEFDETRRAELEHRYFRAIKVAGTFAFVEELLTLDASHVEAAIKIVEESGEAFQKMMERDPVHVTLARYIASAGTDLTKHDLYANLSFFKQANKNEQDNFLSMAMSWGYGRHIVIKKRFTNNIEVYTGETLRETSLDALSLSYSTMMAHNYESGTLSFDDLPNLTQLEDHHWSTHGYVDGHRCYEKAIPGFNMLVFDIDGGIPLELCHELLSDYVFMTYTTKRHGQDGQDRYRLIIPMNYELKLDKEDYKELYKSVLDWLPFKATADQATLDLCRKWATHPGDFYQNKDAVLFDVVPFIPKTKSNDDRVAKIKPLASMDNLERWFAQNWADGARNNAMLRYALALADTGMTYEDVSSKVLSFNAMMEDPLPPQELQQTVLVTVAKHLSDHAA